MKKIVAAALLCILEIMLMGERQNANAQILSPAQDQSNKIWYTQTTDTMLKRDREVLEPFLNGPDLSVEKTIEYDAVPSGNVNARAIIQNGQRVVLVASGFTQVMQWVVDAYIAENELEFRGCFFSYLQYLSDGIEENTIRSNNFETLEPVGPVFWFAASGSNPCNGLTSDAFFKNPDAVKSEAHFMDNCIFFVFAHETAHQVLGHIDNPPQNNFESRMHETAADEWAVKEMIISGINPFTAVPAFFLFSALSGSTLEDEQMSTHPLGIRRLDSLLHNIEILGPATPGYFDVLKQRGELDDYLMGLAQSRAAVDTWMKQLGLK